MSKRPAYAILVIAALIVSASATDDNGLEDQPRARPTTALTVMTFNVGDPSRKGFPVDTVAECILRDGRADILLLQEASGCNASLHLPARLGYQNSLAALAHSIRGSGLCVLSNLPILGREEYALPNEGKGAGALCARLDLNGRRLRACSVHLDATWSDRRSPDGQFRLTITELAKLAWAEFFGATSRRFAVKALLWQLRGETEMPTLLGGDFNTVPWSSPIRTISRSFHDVAWLTKSYLQGTYHNMGGPFRPRIDYLFVSRDLQAQKTQVIPCSTGDHYPVRTELRL